VTGLPVARPPVTRLPRALLLDRDGVVVVNKRTNLKRPQDLVLEAGVVAGLRRLRQAGVRLAICTNQPEIARGALSAAALDSVHAALARQLADAGAAVEFVLTCGAARKCPRRKPSPGMLREAMARLDASPADTLFVGDQLDDLRAAFHARCGGVLVLTGLGRRTLVAPRPSYVEPLLVCRDLAHLADTLLMGQEAKAVA
jgi:D-glycero-D-manno-heptose 1,7-bisphosphate phosphatase